MERLKRCFFAELDDIIGMTSLDSYAEWRISYVYDILYSLSHVTICNGSRLGSTPEVRKTNMVKFRSLTSHMSNVHLTILGVNQHAITHQS